MFPVISSFILIIMLVTSPITTSRLYCSRLISHHQRHNIILGWKLLSILHISTTCTRTISSVSALRIAVIGGGASGIFSSIHAATTASRASEVVVFEAGPKTLGKVKISGGGRCNVLHDTSIPITDVLGSYPRGSKELRGLYHKHWTPQDSREWFEGRGVQLKTEGDGRMFPVTDDSQTIIDTLLKAAEEVGVDIRRKNKVMDIKKDETSGCFKIYTKDSEEIFDSIIMATGSSKAGHEISKQLGHTIIDPVPSLFTLNAAKSQIKEGDGLLKDLSGVSVQNARLSFKFDNSSSSSSSKRRKKKVLTQEGPLLITHHGISGPSTLRLSAFGAREFHKISYKGDVSVHWAPHLGNSETIANQLWQYTTITPKRAISTSCPLRSSSSSSSPSGETTAIIPKRLWSAMVSADGVGIPKEMKWCEVSKKKVNALARMISDCTIHVTGKSTNKDEFVTAGGVALKEVNMKTMESKLCPGLFFCGEVLDIDGVTGGFNFMGCWSTGYTAGLCAAADK